MRPIIPRPWVVLLAAGASRRFGGPKQLARVGGEALLRRMARVALASGPAGCVVVLGARAARVVRALAGLEVRVVVNTRWREGLARSLAAGIAVLPADAGGALVLLADQAAIGPAELALLQAAWRRTPGRIVAARVGDTLGPPVILPRSEFAALRRLRGDRGAARLLRDPRRRTVGLELAGAGIDIDRPSDLAALSALSVPGRKRQSLQPSRARRRTR